MVRHLVIAEVHTRGNCFRTATRVTKRVQRRRVLVQQGTHGVCRALVQRQKPVSCQVFTITTKWEVIHVDHFCSGQRRRHRLLGAPNYSVPLAPLCDN